MNNSVDFVNNNLVEVNSDNRNVPHMLRVDSKKNALQDITMYVHNLCHEKIFICLNIAQHTKADTLNRMSDYDDLSIEQVV